jgi:hypothetical protein
MQVIRASRFEGMIARPTPPATRGVGRLVNGPTCRTHLWRRISVYASARRLVTSATPWSASIRALRPGGFTPPAQAPSPVGCKLLIGQDSDQDDRAHDREVERAWNTQQIDEILKYLKQDRAKYDSEDGAFAAAKRAAAEHRRGDPVKLIEIAVRGRRNGPRVHHEIHRGQTGQAAGDNVGGRDHRASAYAGIARRLLIFSDSRQIAAEH